MANVESVRHFSVQPLFYPNVAAAVVHGDAVRMGDGFSVASSSQQQCRNYEKTTQVAAAAAPAEEEDSLEFPPIMSVHEVWH